MVRRHHHLLSAISESMQQLENKWVFAKRRYKAINLYIDAISSPTQLRTLSCCWSFDHLQRWRHDLIRNSDSIITRSFCGFSAHNWGNSVPQKPVANIVHKREIEKNQVENRKTSAIFRTGLSIKFSMAKRKNIYQTSQNESPKQVMKTAVGCGQAV